MSIFKLPVSVYKAIERKIASLRWKRKESKPDIYQRKWEVLKNKKDEGGLRSDA